MSDKFDEIFSELDDYYPGSKRKRRDPAPEKIVEANSWEKNAFKKTLPNGNTVDMYTLGSLALALGRSVKTLRFWIDEGKLPTSPYRLPNKIGSNGKEYAGRRLYSKDMVDATVELFQKYRLMGKDRVEWSNYRNLTTEIAEAWDKIRANEMKTN